jgi:hypothetical protein
MRRQQYARRYRRRRRDDQWRAGRNEHGRAQQPAGGSHRDSSVVPLSTYGTDRVLSVGGSC